MKRADQLRQLQTLSQMILDSKLFALDRAAQARQISLDRMAELDRPVDAPDLSPIVAGEVAMRYQTWADMRRAEINLTLARQTVELAEAKEAATEAFGRDTALGAVRGKITRA